MPSSGYSAWSVVAGEQPTTAKWNILGTNDSSFNTGNGFNDGIILNRHLATSATLTPNVKPSSFYNLFTITSPAPAGATTVFTNTFTYTTGSTPESIFVWWNVNCSPAGVVGSVLKLVNNGVAVGDPVNADGPANNTLQHGGFYKINSAASTANVLAIQVAEAAGAVFNIVSAYIVGFAVSNA